MTRRRFPLSVYRGILMRQRGLCACDCGEKFDGISDVRFDHIVPLHLDGPDTPENLQALKHKHHVVKSGQEAGIRAKVARIQARDGLLKKRPSARDKVMAKVLGLGDAA